MELKERKKTRENYISFALNVLILKRLNLLRWTAGHSLEKREKTQNLNRKTRREEATMAERVRWESGFKL